MSESVISKVEKSALDKIRKLIEEEIKENQTKETLDLTDIFQAGIEVSNHNIYSNINNDEYKIKKFIRSQIQIIIKQELKKSLKTGFSEIIEPLLKYYLKSTNKDYKKNDKFQDVKDKFYDKPISGNNKELKLDEFNSKRVELKTKASSKSKNSIKNNKETKLKDVNKKLEKMTKAELKEIGKKYNLNIDFRRKKEHLVTEIKKIIEKK